MSNHTPEEIRNIVLVGHGGVGKTSLADVMLFKAGVGTRAGSVDDGTSLLDCDDEERRHHFSISSSMVHYEHAGLRVNVIDTPGYPDFVGQVISAVCAAETALITINAGAGIQANTRKTFQLAGDAHLARMIVINKCDGENIDVPELIESIRETFGTCCLPVNLPLGTGEQFSEVVETLVPPQDRSVDGPADLRDWHEKVVDAVVEADEELMERFLEGEQLTPDEIHGGVTKAIAAGTLVPILFTSAKTGIGVPELIDAIGSYALSPQEMPRYVLRDGTEVEVPQSDDEPLLAQVFKTRIDPFVSKMSFIRVFSGCITKDMSVTNVRSGRSIKLHQLLDIQGGEHEPVDQVHAGEVFVVPKVEDLIVGDTLTGNGVVYKIAQPEFPTPMISLAIEPKSRNDQQKISGALHKLEEEDQTFQVVRDEQTHEIVMRGMSELHLQIARERLHERDKVDVITHPPKIAYRETVTDTAEGSYRHKKQSGGSGQFAEVHLRIAPLPSGIDPDEYFTSAQIPGLRSYHYDERLNFAFCDCISGGSVPNQYIPAVEKGVRECMARGILAGYQVQDIVVSLFFGKDHPVDSNETAFRTAASHCLKEIFMQARPMLLEPLVKMEITVPEQHVGDVSSDLSSRRGRMEGMDVAGGGMQIIHAQAPLAEVMTYARALSSMTGGQGAFSMELSHYEMVPPNEQQKIVKQTDLEPVGA